MTTLRKWLMPLVAAGARAVGMSTTTAQAGDWGYGWGGYGGGHYHAPSYHGPSLHYHRTYHPTYYHYTPYGGLHSHGHYDYVPHYTPGHYHW